jgi:hypothetical protein
MSTVTKNNYEKAIKRLEKANLTLTDYEAVCKWINELNLKLTSKKLYYVALMNYFKKSDPGLFDVYRLQFAEINSELLTETREQKLTPTEREKYLPYDEICEVQDTINLSPYISLEDKILTAFYTRMPPVRADYSRLRIYYNKRPEVSENHIQIWGEPRWDLNAISMEIYISEHKTSGSSGTLKRIIPMEVKHMLHDYLNALAVTAGVSVREYLEREEPMYLFDFAPIEITTRLQRVFQRYTGKAISVNIIRHSYITKQTEGRPPLAQLEQEAQEMGHSMLTHELYRRLDA